MAENSISTISHRNIYIRNLSGSTKTSRIEKREYVQGEYARQILREVLTPYRTDHIYPTPVEVELFPRALVDQVINYQVTLRRVPSLKPLVHQRSPLFVDLYRTHILISLY